MGTKHTPGPWFTKREGFSTVYVEARIGGGFLQEVAACGPTAAGIQQQDSNAKLIAAAPDLLEALKEARRIVADSLEAFGECDHSVGICNCDMKRSIEASDAAIKKATE